MKEVQLIYWMVELQLEGQRSLLFNQANILIPI